MEALGDSEVGVKKVCVIGLGYIGLPTACILSSKGFKVVGVDRNQKLVKELDKFTRVL